MALTIIPHPDFKNQFQAKITAETGKLILGVFSLTIRHDDVMVHVGSYEQIEVGLNSFISHGNLIFNHDGTRRKFDSDNIVTNRIDAEYHDQFFDEMQEVVQVLVANETELIHDLKIGYERYKEANKAIRVSDLTEMINAVMHDTLEDLDPLLLRRVKNLALKAMPPEYR